MDFSGGSGVNGAVRRMSGRSERGVAVTGSQPGGSGLCFLSWCILFVVFVLVLFTFIPVLVYSVCCLCLGIVYFYSCPVLILFLSWCILSVVPVLVLFTSIPVLF